MLMLPVLSCQRPLYLFDRLELLGRMHAAATAAHALLYITVTQVLLQFIWGTTTLY